MIQAASAANPAPPKSQAVSYSDDSSGSLIDDSLTDIRWLGSMEGRMNFPPIENMDHRLRAYNRHQKPQNKGRICKKLSYNKKDIKTEAQKIRPPFSYAALISLAINSVPRKMLTLNSIYQWIENNFPFFRMPEARAWKNSIRHNLSIKKNLFQKVYIDPPRRGNGAYWTLLSEGIDEVERCMKLFTTLRPPIIDKSSIYYHQNSFPQQVVRSRGQFMPASVDGDVQTALCIEVQTETDTNYEEYETQNTSHDDIWCGNPPQLVSNRSVPLKHPLEYCQEFPRAYPPSIQPFNPMSSSSTVTIDAHNDHSNSSFPDLSFLTPMKADMLQGSDSISISPLLNYITTPKDKRLFQQNVISLSPLNTPIKPLEQEAGNSDSGVFSPSNLHFYTPTKDITNLLQLNTPRNDLFHQFESTPSTEHSTKPLLYHLDTRAQL